MSNPFALGGVAGAAPPAPAPAPTPSGGFGAVPGSLLDAEVVQVQTAAQAAAGSHRLQTQLMLRLGDALVAATLPGPPPQPGARLSLIYLGTQGGQPQFLLAPQAAQPPGAAQPQLSAPARLLLSLIHI